MGMGMGMARALTTAVAVVCVGALAGCVSPGRGGVASPGHTGSAPASTPAGGIDQATMKSRLMAIPGVTSVELYEEKGFDTGHYQQANIEVASSDRATALRIADRALAVMWQGPQDSDKRVAVWVQAANGRIGLADDHDVDPAISGPDHRSAMAERYGPWPGRGVPPTP